jgi:hypothetical protein
MARCCRLACGSHREGVEQGGRGRCGVEVVEKSWDSDVHRRGEGSGGRW